MTEEAALAIVLVTLILTVGFVAVVRPIAKPLVRLIEAMIQERQPGAAVHELGRIRSVLERVDDRIGMLEERQSFYEALSDGVGSADRSQTSQEPARLRSRPGAG